MRASTLLVFFSGVAFAMTAPAQTGRTMQALSPLAIGTDFRFSISHPAAAAGHPYLVFWSGQYPGAVQITVPGLQTNGLLRLDPSWFELAATGGLGSGGATGVQIPVPNASWLLGWAIDVQSVDLDLAIPGVYLADNDLSAVVAGLRQEWVVRYDGSMHGHDNFRAVVADGATVFATGSSLGFRPSDPFNPYTYEIVTHCYSPSGQVQWERRYDSPGTGFDDTGVDIARAPNGDVVVLGQGPGSSGDQDVVVLCYDAQGTQRWVSIWSNSWSDSAVDLGIAVDGSIYVLANSANGATVTDVVLLKFSAAGMLLWQRFFDGGFSGTDVGVGLGFDSHGHIAIGGYSVGVGGGTNLDWIAVEYDAAGNQLWNRRLVGSPTQPDYCWGMTVDPLNRVVLTGTLNSNPGGYALAAFDDVGAHLWTTLLGVPGGAPYAEVRWDAGYLVCTSQSSVIGVDLTGAVAWQQSVPGQARAIEADAVGNVVVTSSVMSPTGANTQFVVSAFNSAGASLGRQEFGWPRVDEFASRGLTILGDAVYAVGATQNASGNTDGLLVRFSLWP